MAYKTKNVLSRLNAIAAERTKFHLLEGSSTSLAGRFFNETLPHIDDIAVYGADEYRARIIYCLTKRQNDKYLSVISIVGMAGIGKTTLAQSVYNDERIMEFFELRIWVYVGEEFDVKDIITKISHGHSSSDLEVYDRIREKRFLLILDDVWNEHPNRWETLQNLLRGGKVGSKIMITTRSDEVAKIMGTVDTPFRMKGLPFEDCWKLFKERAFQEGSEKESPRLVEIGMEMVKKCGGVPLAVKALAVLMTLKRGENEWLEVLESDIWRSSGDSMILDSLTLTLRLTYYHLPRGLRQCFAYCSLFPQGYQINRLKLTQLWIAAGFIHKIRDDIEVEDIADQYFDTLLRTSLLERHFLSDTVFYSMHDLACNVAQSDFSRSNFSSVKSDETGSVPPLRSRYVSVNFDRVKSLALKISAMKLRSLHLFKSITSSVSIEKFELSPLNQVTHLRVMDFGGIEMSVFPEIITKLKHLRFLDVSGFSVEELPNSIASLYHLETLNLRGCDCLRRLPKGIGNLMRLRHLDISGCASLTGMPHGFGRLTDLRTLPFFIVGEGTRCGGISELQNLNHISGELRIGGLENVRDPKEVIAAKLCAKPKIKMLELRWCHNWSEDNAREEEEEAVLQELLSPPNLRQLLIQGYGGKRFPDRLSCPSSLPHLQRLCLKELRRCERLPTLGQLFSLEHLEIEGLSALKRIERELYGDRTVVFLHLKYLCLKDLPNLEELFVSETERENNAITIEFPSLERLVIFWCPKLRQLPLLPWSSGKLKIIESNQELLEGTSLQGLPRLRDLTITSMTASSGWKGLGFLTDLQELVIDLCNELNCLPGGVMDLPSLRILKLHSAQKMKTLEGPSRPRFCALLKQLIIIDCGALNALPKWVGDLTSLHYLEIKWCKGISILPEGLQRLSELEKLTIYGCPLLEGRCQMETGEDWHKIAHIPKIVIKST